MSLGRVAAIGSRPPKLETHNYCRHLLYTSTSRFFAMSSTSPNMPHFIEDTAVMIEQADAVASRGDDEPIRTKNRRIRYLELHPDYFEDPGLELAGRCSLVSSSNTQVPINSQMCYCSIGWYVVSRLPKNVRRRAV